MTDGAERLGENQLRHEARSFGYVIAATGYIHPDEAAATALELKRRVMHEGRKEFGFLLDARRQPVQPPGTTAIIQELMRWLYTRGVRRAAVVGDSAMVLLQTRRLVTESGAGGGVRYIDVRHTQEWERAAVGWIERGVEPGAPGE